MVSRFQFTTPFFPCDIKERRKKQCKTLSSPSMLLPVPLPLLLLLLPILLLFTSSVFAQKSTDDDQLQNDPQIYRGTIKTGIIPTPQRGMTDKETSSLYQGNPIIVSGTSMASWYPIGASGPDPGQVTRNALPSNVFCESDNGECKVGKDGTNATSRSDRKKCPTGIEWLALGMAFDRRPNNVYWPIHSIDIYSAIDGEFFNPSIETNNDATFFTVEVYIGHKFRPASDGGSTLIHSQLCTAKGSGIVNTCSIVLPEPTTSHNIWIKAIVPDRSVKGTNEISICDMKIKYKPWQDSMAANRLSRQILLDDGLTDSLQVRFQRAADSNTKQNDGKGTELAFTSLVHECSFWAGSTGQTKVVIGKIFDRPRMIKKIYLRPMSNNNWCNSGGTNMIASLYCGDEFYDTGKAPYSKKLLGSKNVKLYNNAWTLPLTPYPVCKAVWLEVEKPTGDGARDNSADSCGLCKFDIFESVGNELGVIFGKDSLDMTSLHAEEKFTVMKYPTWTIPTQRRYSTDLPVLKPYDREITNGEAVQLQQKVHAVHLDVTTNSPHEGDGLNLGSKYLGGRLDGASFVNMTRAFDIDIETGVTTEISSSDNGMLLGRRLASDQPFSRVVLQASTSLGALVEHPNGVQSLNVSFVVKVGHAQDHQNGIVVGRKDFKELRTTTAQDGERPDGWEDGTTCGPSEGYKKVGNWTTKDAAGAATCLQQCRADSFGSSNTQANGEIHCQYQANGCYKCKNGYHPDPGAGWYKDREDTPIVSWKGTNLKPLPKLFILTKSKQKYDDGVQACSDSKEVSSLWKYTAASVRTATELREVAELLKAEKVDKAYIGATEQWSGDPRWKWEDGSISLLEFQTYLQTNDAWKDTSNPQETINRDVNEDTLYNRITVTQSAPKGWEDTSSGEDILHMVCRRQHSTYQEVSIDLDVTKEAKEIWVEIFSTSHPQARIHVGEMKLYVQRYERVWSDYRTGADYRDKGRGACFHNGYKESVTPEDCIAVKSNKGYSYCSSHGSFGQLDYNGKKKFGWVGQWSGGGIPRGCVYNFYWGTCLAFNKKETNHNSQHQNYGPICKKIQKESLPVSYRPWLTSKSNQVQMSRWKTKVMDESADLYIEPEKFSGWSKNDSASQAILLSKIGFGTIEMSYTISRMTTTTGDQKIYMGMTTTTGGSECKASDMMDLVQSNTKCKKGGFVLEHTLKGGSTRKGLYSQSHSQSMSKAYYGSPDYILRGDSFYRLRENENVYMQPTIVSSVNDDCEDLVHGAVFRFSHTCSKIVFDDKCTRAATEYDKNGHVARRDCCGCGGGDTGSFTDTGPYRVKVIRNGIDGSVHVTINGKSMSKNNFLSVGYDPLQPWFQVDGVGSVKIENVVIKTRATNFLEFAHASWSLMTSKPKVEVTFSDLPLSYDGNDHLILIARTPPWRKLATFQIVDKGCHRRNCIQCDKDQNCKMCGRGFYLHGSICIQQCPTGTTPLEIDLSSTLRYNSVFNWEGQTSNIRRATPVDCKQDNQVNNFGTPISGIGSNACNAFDNDQYTTHWTSQASGQKAENDKWLGYHFNVSRAIVAYKINIDTPFDRTTGSSSPQIGERGDVPGQWVVEGARDDHLDGDSTKYDERKLDRNGWVVLDDSHAYEALYTSGEVGPTSCRSSCNNNGWTCPNSNYNNQKGVELRYTCKKHRRKTFSLPKTSTGLYHRYRLRFMSSSTDGAPDWTQKIYRLELWEKVPTTLGTASIKGRACLGMEDKDKRINRVSGILTFNAATVNMTTKYDPPPNLFWGTNTVTRLGSALRTFALPRNGLLRMKLPSIKRPSTASHLIAVNNDGSWIGSIEIVDHGCNNMLMLSKSKNCAICHSLGCLRCANGTYLDGSICVDKCMGGRVPIDSIDDVGKICAGMYDFDENVGVLHGKQRVPIAPCTSGLRYVGSCTSNVEDCPLKRVKDVMACNLACDDDLDCLALTYEATKEQCWLWSTKTNEQMTTSKEGAYISCTSSRQRQVLADTSTITVLWSDDNEASSSANSKYEEYTGKKCAGSTKTLRGGAVVKDRNECVFLCNNDQACDGITYDATHLICTLLHGCDATQDASSNDLSTLLLKSRTTMCQWLTKSKTNCGDDATLIDRGSVGPLKCRLLCAAHPDECQCYSIQSSDGTCYLSKGGTVGTRSNMKFTSYTKGECSKGHFASGSKLTKDFVKDLYPLVPVSSSIDTVYKIKSLPYKVEIPRCKDSNNIITSWEQCKEANTAMGIERYDDDREYFSCRAGSSSAICQTFYKGCTKCNTNTFNLEKYAPWNYTNAQDFCMSWSANGAAMSADVFSHSPCSQDINQFVLPINIEFSDDNWPHGCFEIQGEGLYFNGKTDSSELATATKFVKSLCHIPTVHSVWTKDKANQHIDSSKYITIHFPQLHFPMEKNENDNPTQVVVVVDQGNNHIKWKAGVQIHMFSIEDAGCSFGCGRCDAVDSCLECHNGLYLSGGTCHTKCMLGDVVVSPVNNAGGACLPCKMPPDSTAKKIIADYGGDGISNMKECEGDCDIDSDCIDALKCFQREVDSDVVPGCTTTGYVSSTSAHDYCYDPGKKVDIGADLPHLSAVEMHVNNNFAFQIPKNRSFVVMAHTSDVSTTLSATMNIESNHKLFIQRESVPSVTVSGMADSNCIVTSIRTTSFALSVTLEPIQTTAPCILKQGSPISLTLVFVDCNSCLAPNPASNQHIRVSVLWSSTSTSTNTIISSSCPIKWYKTRSYKQCSSFDGKLSHSDTKASNVGFKRKIDLSCDSSRANECDVSSKKYVAADGTIVISTNTRANDDMSMSNLFDDSKTTSQFNPSKTFWRTTNYQDNTLKFVFVEPRRLSDVNYRPKFADEKRIEYRIIVKEAYAGGPNGVKFKDMIVDDWRFRPVGSETVSNSYFGFQQWIKRPIPSKSWSSLYGKLSLWIKEIWIEMRRQGSSWVGMDEIEFWQLQEEVGVSDDHCECGGVQHLPEKAVEPNINTKWIAPTQECRRGEYCLGEVGKCMPFAHPVVVPTWLGESNCGCGLVPFAEFCSQCDNYLCTGTCTWPLCDQVANVVYNGKTYDHPCRCSTFTEWNIATPRHLTKLRCTSSSSDCDLSALVKDIDIIDSTNANCPNGPASELCRDKLLNVDYVIALQTYTCGATQGANCAQSGTTDGNTNSVHKPGAKYTFENDVQVTGLKVVNHVNGCSGYSGSVDGVSLGDTSGPCQNRWNSKYKEQEECLFTFASPQTGTTFVWWCTVAAAHLNSGALGGGFSTYRVLPQGVGNFGTIDRGPKAYQYIMTSGNSYWMSPVTEYLWSWFNQKTIYGTWEYSERGWNPTLTQITEGTVPVGIPSGTIRSFECTESNTISNTGGDVGVACVRKSTDCTTQGCSGKYNGRFVRPKSDDSDTSKKYEGKISLESEWSTIATGEFGFVDKAARVAQVYVRSEQLNQPFCAHKGQCVRKSSLSEPFKLNECTSVCSINRLLERKCTCGSSATTICVPGEQCTADSKCVPQCQESQFSDHNLCICGMKGEVCKNGQACHHETGTCVIQRCKQEDGKGPTKEQYCICSGPTQSEVCTKGQYCISGSHEKPCQSKCNGVITAALSCINQGTEKIYKPRTKRTIDPFGKQRERKWRRD